MIKYIVRFAFLEKGKANYIFNYIRHFGLRRIACLLQGLCGSHFESLVNYKHDFPTSGGGAPGRAVQACLGRLINLFEGNLLHITILISNIKVNVW